MRFLKLSVILLFATSLSYAQATYFVAHVKGDIAVKSTGTPIKVGDQLGSEDELLFKSADARAVVITSQGTRMLLQHQQAAESVRGENEFLSFVKDALLPMKENIQLSTRGGFDAGMDYRKVTNFEKFFGVDKYVIIGEELTLGADASKYPINEMRRFIYRYETEQRPVNKKIQYSGNNLIINKDALYKTKGERINPGSALPVDIIYFDFDKNQAMQLASFEPVFVDEETLLLELKSVATFLESNNIMSQSKIREELFDFVQEVHGPINRNVFNDWLSGKEIFTKG